MITRGTYRTSDNSTKNTLVVKHEKGYLEVFLGDIKGNLLSAYKKTSNFEGSYINNKAKDLAKIINMGINGCTSKNGSPVPFDLGASSKHSFKKSNINFDVERFSDELCNAFITSETFAIELEYCRERVEFPEIPYIKITTSNSVRVATDGEEDIPVRTLEEISLDKDITWLRNKKYYIVNDEETAEKIFSALDNYNSVISFDTETTGLRINMFGQIGSPKKKEIEKYNEELKAKEEDPLRVDRLVGFIYCVERDVSYYFPCFNRKFKNLYNDVSNPVTKKVVDRILADYTVGKYRNRTDYMAEFIRNTPPSEWGSDVILMERNRNILETKILLAHNGTFEWKVCWLYNIDFNLKEDTIILHQLMYKFRSTTSNRGEPSNLKYLSKVELGVDQLELTDFFSGFEEDKGGTVKGSGKSRKKKKAIIDFSYMDYDGSRAYAPADGDLTFQLFLKYKSDMLKNHRELEYLYQVEILVSCAIAYMEFYGHRIDEDKIENIRKNYISEKLELELKIRDMINYSDDNEKQVHKELNELNAKIVEFDNKIKSLKDDKANDEEINKIKNDRTELYNSKEKLQEKIVETIGSSSKELNLASPQQVANLFFDELGYPTPEEKKSVSKKVIKGLVKQKNSDGTARYPVAKLYSDWKNVDTLLTKFFDNLPDYMYPGGFIFSSYGQISTATGRMSCNKPNAQQYPKTVTKIVCPRPGYIMIDADFSQIEYRTLVAMANEPDLLEKFKDPDMDYHTTMASLMYSVPYAAVTPKMRGDAKSFNFGIPYGMGFGSLAILLTGLSNESTRREAMEKYELYFKDQPNVRMFFNDVKEFALVNRYTETKWHRRRYYSFEDKDGKFSQSKKAMALRQAGNAIIQGCLGENTRIQTKEYGIVKIKDVVGQRLQVWDGDKWSHGDITYSGKKQKCVITFSNGQKFICSPIHKFLVKSAKGNERFVECQNLRGSSISNNPHRVVVNQKYVQSDFRYTSDWARHYKTFNHMSHNFFIDDIDDKFGAGVILGRIASDGSIIKRDIGASYLLNYIAEHELNIVPILKKYMKNWKSTYSDNDVRSNRNEKVDRLNIYSESLVNEVCDLDIKHQIDDNIFMDTELLRGFISGFFDGDGGISGKTITLTFGTQYDFEEMCLDMQKALLFFGIRSRYRKYDYRYVLTIKTNDNQKFLDIIGFVNEHKNEAGRKLKCIKEEKLFGPTLVVESVEITNDYIDMYDVCNTDGGYYVADGIITHNTAADIFKIAVARNFAYIRKSGLLGQLLIVNMIHDEQLMEVNCETLNVKKVLSDVICNMEMKLAGFPPLYVGAGVGVDWADAKGKMAEIHPLLGEQYIHESQNDNVWASSPSKPEDVLEYFNQRVLEFRTQKIIDYAKNPENYNQPLHPVIGNLLGLQFDYGVNKEYEKEYTEDNGYTKEEIDAKKAEIPLEQLRRFLEAHGLSDIDINLFKDTTVEEEEEEDKEYTDGDEDEDIDGEADVYGGTFALIDEDPSLYGISIQDIISQFGLLVSQERKICGIDLNILPMSKKDELFQFLEDNACEDSDDGAMEVVFLMSNNILKRTGVYVKGINGSSVATKFKINPLIYK